MADALASVELVRERADLVELRLDLIQDVDIPRLLRARDCPAIVTFRPVREGGAYAGDEQTRLTVLRQAALLGAEWIDVELDAADALGRVTPARRIVSHHDFDSVPEHMASWMARLWDAGADAAKLAVMPRSPGQVADVLTLLRNARGPTIALGMGEFGVASRLLCLSYDTCFLTFAAPEDGQGTAPGQISLDDMEMLYRARSIDSSTRWLGYLGSPGEAELRVLNQRLGAMALNVVAVPLGESSLALEVEALVRLGLRGGYVPQRKELEAAKLLPAWPPSPPRGGRANVVVSEARRAYAGHTTNLEDHLLGPVAT
jgi:3-dehydroquinate dehydratase/shikimate dehydrogenase